MKLLRIAGIVAVAAAGLSLGACTYYHTTEQPAPQTRTTVVVPQAAPTTVIREQPRGAVVLPRPGDADPDTVTVAPDSTVTVVPRPNN